MELRLGKNIGLAGRLAGCCVVAWAALAAAQTTNTTDTIQGTANRDHQAARAGLDSTEESVPKHSPHVTFADVQLILRQHCLKCHSAEKHSGGLRLDSREGALRGGDSGKSILDSTLENSELYARVSSDDRNFRMPKNAGPLSPNEIDTIRQWLEQGATWPKPIAESSYPFSGWLESFGRLFDRYRDVYDDVYPFLLAFLGFLILVLVVLRTRAAYRGGRAWTTGRLAAFCRFCDLVRTSELLLVLLLAVAVILAAIGRSRVIQAEKQIAQLQKENSRRTSPWTNSAYGWPPRPVRMDGPKHVSATYYRGNCERNEALFNGGNYLTSIFRVSLCNREHRPLKVGDVIPEDGVFLRFEIERAPGTTDLLFSPEGMESVALVTTHQESEESRLEQEPTRLETLEPMWRWVAYAPLGKPTKGSEWQGVIYVYTGQIHGDHLDGTLQYGIEYHLETTGGKLSPESDLWMDSFGNSFFAEPTPAGKLPYKEWFSDQPLPVIVGENTKDPKLLGIDEHVRKGFIRPQPEQKSAPQNSSATPADQTPRSVEEE